MGPLRGRGPGPITQEKTGHSFWRTGEEGGGMIGKELNWLEGGATDRQAGRKGTWVTFSRRLPRKENQVGFCKTRYKHGDGKGG